MTKRQSGPIAAALIVALLAGAGGTGAARAQAVPITNPRMLPEGDGRDAVGRKCGQCHSLGLVTSQRHTRAEWESVLARMGDRGFYASEAERGRIVDYLTRHFGPAPRAARGAS